MRPNGHHHASGVSTAVARQMELVWQAGISKDVDPKFRIHVDMDYTWNHDTT